MIILIFILLFGIQAQFHLSQAQDIQSPPAIYGHSSNTILLNSSYSMLTIGGWPWDIALPDTNTHRIFNYSTLSWSLIHTSGSSPVPRHYHSTSSIHDGSYLVLFGGYMGQVYFNDVYLLDTSLLEWYLVPTQPGCTGCFIPTGRSGHSQIALDSTSDTISDTISDITGLMAEMVIYGGINENQGTQALGDIYHLQLLVLTPGNYVGSWVSSDLSTPIQNRVYHSANLYSQELMFIFGGSSDGFNPLSDLNLHVYNVISREWQRSIPGPNINPVSGIYGHSAQLVDNDDLVIIGGYISNDFFDSVLIFSIPTSSWKVMSQDQVLNGVSSPYESRRAATITSFVSDEQNFLVYFGGTQIAATSELDLFLLNENSNEVNLARAAISSISIEPSSLFEGMFQLDLTGWGFANETDINYNSVDIYELIDIQDPDSSSGVRYPCITQISDSPSSYSCITMFQPRGYFNVTMQSQSSPDDILATAQRLGYACLMTGYFELELSNGNDSSVVCIPKPQISSVSPSSGQYPSIISINGTGFIQPGLEYDVTIGSVECIVFELSDTQLQCTLGIHYAESKSNIEIGFKYVKNGYIGLFNASSDLAFDYSLQLSRLYVTEYNQWVFRGYGFGDGIQTQTQVEVIDNNLGETYSCFPIQYDGYRFVCQMPLSNMPFLENMTVVIMTSDMENNEISYPVRLQGTSCAMNFTYFVIDNSLLTPVHPCPIPIETTSTALASQTTTSSAIINYLSTANAERALKQAFPSSSLFVPMNPKVVSSTFDSTTSETRTSDTQEASSIIETTSLSPIETVPNQEEYDDSAPHSTYSFPLMNMPRRSQMLLAVIIPASVITGLLILCAFLWTAGTKYREKKLVNALHKWRKDGESEWDLIERGTGPHSIQQSPAVPNALKSTRQLSGHNTRI